MHKNTEEAGVQMSMNPLVESLQKPATDFTRQDIIRYINEHGIQMLNFRYVGGDGKLKTLNFVVTDREYLESVLATGERVDGSSLFDFVESDSSDLYVIPRFSTAFRNPFAEIPTLDILCSFYNRDGEPLESSPEYILRKASRLFYKQTGLQFKAMGELEYYIFSEHGDLYPPEAQRGYHASEPFTNFEWIRTEAMRLIAQCGGRIKYGHSEVGSFSDGPIHYEQHEIEFIPVEPVEAVEQLLLAKWVLRMLGRQHNVTVSFAPKITPGQAGSGLHIHFLAERDGQNIMADEEGITREARKMIAGVLAKAASLTAFGNTIPTSYLRLVPHQEAPVKVCWGKENRSALVRVPLGWNTKTNMVKHANPQEMDPVPRIGGKQTVEFRVADGSANLYLLMAGLIQAAAEGLNASDSLERADVLFVDVNIFAGSHRELHDRLESLPASCAESADLLERDREFYIADGVFPAGLVDSTIKKLRSYGDASLRERLENDRGALRELVGTYIHTM
ncbi:MAG: glutamine synthetase [Spirochaetaceae bacterium]|nr:glutamine synthetase [Spirochaetaceae bacterium]|tara:strand:+ start:8516 stop:10033 length:1518 start_codon:yes stop_codon:yes gene_type:complete